MEESERMAPKISQDDYILLEGTGEEGVNVAGMAVFFCIVIILWGIFCIWKQDWIGVIACGIGASAEGIFAFWNYREQRKEKAAKQG